MTTESQITDHHSEIPKRRKPNEYTEAFKDWMDCWKPHAFITVNLPKELDKSRVPRDAQFYLNCWTRCAEADVLGTRSLKVADYDRRIVWLFRREVAPDGLIHYHGIAKFPTGRTWRHEQPGNYSVVDRCDRLQHALRVASSRTPEPFTPSRVHYPNAADIAVVPFDAADHNHAGYTLKGMWRFVPEWVSDETTYDSGLIILPHLPKRGTTEWQPNNRHATT